MDWGGEREEWRVTGIGDWRLEIGFVFCNTLSAICDLRFAICDLRFALCDVLDAVKAKGAFGTVAVAVANEIIVVTVGFKEMGFDDADGGFVGVGGVVGDGERGLGLEGVLNLGEMF